MLRRTAKIFTYDGSQAVRLPVEFRFDVDEVIVEKVGDKLILTPKRSGWDDFFDRPSAVPADFLDQRSDDPPQERELFSMSMLGSEPPSPGFLTGG